MDHNPISFFDVGFVEYAHLSYNGKFMIDNESNRSSIIIDEINNKDVSN